ncbi:MAG: cell division protein ZapA [Candidatus Parabeggiatoa sp. nov. 1]|nr:MAG: cell division protein ZapA [Gammaproteobacteria bacterium]
MNSDKSVPVNLRILDKDYVVACPEDERDTLMASARFLNEKVQQIRGGGKVVSTERIVVISALNIVHEYLQYKQQKDDDINTIENDIVQLQEKIGLALLEIKS